MPSSKKDTKLERLRKAYEDELKAKDRQIEELKKKEELMLRACLKESRRNVQTIERLETLMPDKPKKGSSHNR